MGESHDDEDINSTYEKEKEPERKKTKNKKVKFVDAETTLETTFHVPPEVVHSPKKKEIESFVNDVKQNNYRN